MSLGKFHHDLTMTEPHRWWWMWLGNHPLLWPIYQTNHCWMVAAQPARCRRRRNWKPSLSHCHDAKAPRQGAVIEKVWHRKTIGKPWENEGLLSGYVNIAIENGQLEWVFPVKHGDFPELCHFTRGYASYKYVYVCMPNTNPFVEFNRMHNPIEVTRYN